MSRRNEKGLERAGRCRRNGHATRTEPQFAAVANQQQQLPSLGQRVDRTYLLQSLRGEREREKASKVGVESKES